MEQINYQEEYKRLFSAYRTNPAEPDESVLQAVEILIDKFPFCQPLHFIYAAALKNDSGKFESRLAKASLRTSQRVKLFQTIHHPEKLVLKGNIVLQKEENIIEQKNFTSVPEEIIEQADVIEEKPVTSEQGQNHDQESVEFDVIREEIVSETTNLHSEMESETDIVESELMMDNVAATDYFTFDKSVADLLGQDEKDDSGREETEVPEQNTVRRNRWDADTQSVSRYHDDKLPYTFLWWLNKTRKEHNDTYQPYVNFKLDTTKPIRKISDQLNQQIIENIFHLQIPLEDKKRKKASKTVDFELKKKDGGDIIEKFIKEDPQIRPMQPEKIDTENKARKSSEDLNDMVSETLARIYVEQMLFDKAIEAYKKLSLRFPEKNAYFADQISDLEKKIN